MRGKFKAASRQHKCLQCCSRLFRTSVAAPAPSPLTAPQRDTGRQHCAAAQQRRRIASRNLAQQVAPEEGRLHQACRVGSSTTPDCTSGVWCARNPPLKRYAVKQQGLAGAAAGSRRAGRRTPAAGSSFRALQGRAAPPATVGLHPKSWAIGMIATEMLTCRGQGVASKNNGRPLGHAVLMRRAPHGSSAGSWPCARWRAIQPPAGSSTRHPPCPCYR